MNNNHSEKTINKIDSSRTILHCDMNGFFASVELLERPDLKDLPVAVAGNPENRHGIILAKNEIAKKYGITTAETIISAKRKCPSLKLLPPHYDKYEYYYHKINAIYLDYTDQVEPYSIDESWLDITGSLKLFDKNFQDQFKSGKKIADEIRQRVKHELGLTLSAGVSFNKVFAKMGSEYKKPDATTVVTPNNFKQLLWPLPAGEFFFIGRKTCAKLQNIGIMTIGDLATTDINVLTNLLGANGTQLFMYANGLDTSPVNKWDDKEDPKTIGHGMTFRRDLLGREDVSLAVTELSDRVASRIRHYKMKSYGVKVEITDPDFNRRSRQKQLDSPYTDSVTLRKTAMKLIEELGYINKPIRHIAVSAISLQKENDAEQLSLFSMEGESGLLNDNMAIKKEKNNAIESAVDKIREKYGDEAICFAHSINNDLGIKSKKDKHQ